jgi:gamma-glutamyltranspeptidase/glutathione hydrolase
MTTTPLHTLVLSLVLLSVLALAACTGAQQPVADAPMDPEKATGMQQQSLVSGTTQMVVAANPHAAKQGFAVLERGGTVVDAAIAIQATLSLVEPQSSGIGGGAFILYWSAGDKKLYTFDARETAPAAATPDLFMVDGQPLQWIEAIVGGKAVGVPGVLKGLNLAHERYGKLPWNSLFEGAAQLAEGGFEVSPRMAKLVGYRFHPGLYQLEPAASYFYPGGEALTAGTWLRNPELALSLRMIAEHGVDYFYRGPLAHTIVDTVQNSSVRPGLLTLEDMQSYTVRERAPVCADYRIYRLCGMDQPSSGGLAVLQIFGILEQFDMPSREPWSLDATHLFTQASRLAYADRNRYSADPDFTEIPVAGLLNDEYLQQRAGLINPARDMGLALPGQPDSNLALADDDSFELPSTSHMVLVDQYGNALSMTTSIEMAFGSSLMAGGFLLNNQLTDFSLTPTRDGKPVANRVQPGKRPRSSLAPFVVFNADGSLRALVGSPGGSRIIDYVAKTLLGILDWELDVQQAINLPNITNRNDQTTVELGRVGNSLVQGLIARGHNVKQADLNSGIHAIEVEDGVMYGGADPRREGLVLAR